MDNQQRGQIAAERGDGMDVELSLWLERLKRIDAVLESPSISLVELGEHFLITEPATRLPSWISQTARDEKRSLLVHSLVCSTLQRLWRTHRRHSWMRKPTRKRLQRLQSKIVESAENIGQPILTSPVSAPGQPPILTILGDPIFGNLNPFVSAEVFWILLHGGQNRVGGAAGFLCLFSMLWALLAMHSPELVQSGDPRTLAASIAAKCLRPILEFQVMFRRRAKLYRQVRQVCKELKELSAKQNPHARWKFALGADRLSALMLEMSTVAVNQGTFENTAQRISDIAKTIHPRHTTSPWDDIHAELVKTLADLRDVNEAKFAESIVILDEIRKVVLPAVERDSSSLRTKLRQQSPDETNAQYAARMKDAADDALDRCREVLRVMTSAVTCCREAETTPSPRNARIDNFLEHYDETAIQDRYKKKPVLRTREADDDPVEWTLARLAEANDEIAQIIESAIAAPVKWCRFVVRQEVAYASAGNDTEFDAADLLSAVAIAERAESISELEVEDALAKAMRGLREDGSWTAGQPIYLTRRVLGVWPNTTDIAWLLTGAIIGKAKIRRADPALFAFLDWLDRTRTSFERNLKSTALNDDDTPVSLVGWSSETRESRTIDLWVTAGAINALLEMRDIVEHRLWELCERRFFVFRERDLKPLDDIDPVDLGAIHEHRLHRRLRNTARDVSGPHYRRGEYSFVFHGPPGSSKTAMAEALGREMWRETIPGQRRVVRITPADFTRQGEAGLDAEARFIFDLLRHVRGVTIIFDEIDDLLSRRALKGQPAFLKMIVPAMLNRLQDLRDSAPRQEICFAVAMNYVDNIEPALTRPGRIDAAIPVVYPDPWSRDNTLDQVVADVGPVSDRMRAYIVDATAGWPWPLFNRLCKAVRASYQKGAPTRTDIAHLILDLETQQQDAKAEYANRLRWTPLSPELVNEVAHFAMAFGRTLDNCKDKVQPIFERARSAVNVTAGESTAWVDEVQKAIETRLVSEWKREERAPYSRDMAMRAKGLMGANRVIDIGMTIFRLWAPSADEVHLVRPGDEVPDLTAAATLLEPEEEPGIFSNGVDVRSSQRYRFGMTIGGSTIEVLDPYGREIDGEFNVFDDAAPPSAAGYQTIKNWHDLVIYQVHPETFSDEHSYAGIAKRLDKIQDLECNAIDLIGPGESVRPPFGYDPRARRKDEERFGGTAGLRDLVQAAHERKMSVIVGVTTHDLLGRPGDDLRKFNGPYFPPDMVTVGCGPQPDFEEKRVQDLMLENARRFIEEIGVDGLRWTYTTHLRNAIALEPRGKRAFDFLRSMNERIRALGHDTFLVAVDMTSDDLIVDRIDGANFSTQWSAGLARAIRNTVTTENADLDEMKRAVSRSYKKDQNSADIDAFLRIVFSESHTTVRAKGRLSDVLRAQPQARQRSFLATALSLVTPGIPMILQGQELWNDLPLDSDGVLDWNDGNGALRQRLRDLIRLRRNFERNTGGLMGHNVKVTYRVGERVIVVDRWHGTREGEPGNHTIAVLNFTADDKDRFEVAFPKSGTWSVRYNSHTPEHYDRSFGVWDITRELSVDDHRRHPVRVGAYGLVVLSQDAPPQL